MVSGSGSTSRREGWLSSTKNLGRRPQNRAIKRRAPTPKTGLLNVKRLMACLLLWVARFPSCLVLALACARAWSVVPLSGVLLCSWSCAPCGRRPENRSFPHVSTRRTFDQVSLYSSLRMCMHSRFEFDLAGSEVSAANTKVVHIDAVSLVKSEDGPSTHCGFIRCSDFWSNGNLQRASWFT